MNDKEQNRGEFASAPDVALFENIFYNHTAVGLIIDPSNARILDANHAAANYYGWSREQLRQMSIKDINIFSPQQIKSAMDTALADRKHHFEFRHRLADGSVRDVEVFVGNIRTADGRQLLHSIVNDITQRKEFEESRRRLNQRLKHSEEKFRTIFNSTNDAIFVHSYDGKFVEMNESACTLLGYSRDELMRMSPADIIVKEFSTLAPQRIERIVEEGRLLFETAHRRKDGGVVAVEINARTIDYDHEPCILAVVRDISERKRAEEALHASHEFQRAMIACSPVALYSIDLEGNVQHWNASAERIFGWSAEEVIGKPLPIVPEENTLQYSAHQGEVKRGEEFFCRELTRRKKNGTRFPVSLSVSSIFNEFGELVGIMGAAEDISLRKEAQQQVADEKERLSVTLRSIGDGVITTDIHGNIVSVNRIAEQLTGWSHGDARGKPLKEVFTIINQSSRIRCDNPVEKVIKTGNIIELEENTVLISRDGTERIIADSAAPIRDTNSLTIGVVLVFRDMTEKRKMMETVQRTTKLESLGVLAGGIAHDFNNLLGGIFGYIDMASDLCADEKAKMHLKKCMNTIDRARGLTRQLLTFAKGGDPVRERGSLFPFVSDMVLFALCGSDVSYEFDIPEFIRECDYDKNQIGQVIENVTINALQAMPEGGHIRVSCRNWMIEPSTYAALAPGEYVRIEIADTGAGIPPEVRKRIFDPFFTTKEKGHGLGLASSYSIIARHGGGIEVDTRPGKGTSFFILLPAVSQPCRAAADVEKRMHAPHRGRGTFLIMDDEEVMREILIEMLESLGYDILPTANGTEALVEYENDQRHDKKIIGLICDITIPGGLGGKELITILREKNTDLPVFVASGYAEDPVMAYPKDNGFTDSISKPFRRIDLARMLSKYFPQTPCG